MKNIFRLTVMLLLVSSCGLFKKITKTKESQTVEANEKMTELSSVDSSRRHLEIEQSYNRLLTGSEALMQIEGEEIEISPNGVVRIGKGRVNKRRTYYSDSSNGVEKYLSDQRRESVHNVHYKEDKLRIDERASKRTVQPAGTNIFYFLIGLLVVIYLMVWWLRRRT
ncbi:hypothetical protein [Sphingobacterium sp. GVS05A]|uniref:hypothetical protein n=1 Tax=Sphingobacterium TaxID=28453 RepID=UPI001CC06491|nr:hypothetical protein [Sphingobacterium sp. GVS05A]